MMQFIDLAAQQARIKEKIDLRIQNVLAHGKYIMGPEVAEFEQGLAAFCGVKHALTCGNGTDAITLALMALGTDARDAVFVPSFTFAATAEVVVPFGATPVFVDVDESSFNMDPESLKRAVVHARGIGLNPSVVIPVDLFGLPADYDAILPIAADEGMRVIADTAQGFGAIYKGRTAGNIGDLATTSFFPAKPLGCYGDGGAVLTNDDDLADLIRSFRVHGKGQHKYDNARIGINSRLDTLQAGILCEKLAIFADEITHRQDAARRYSQALSSLVQVPRVPEGLASTWAQYTLRLKDESERDVVMAGLKDAGVPSVVYYPRPLHQQSAYRNYPRDPSGLLTSENLSKQVLSLPMHPYLGIEGQNRVIEAVQHVLRP